MHDHDGAFCAFAVSQAPAQRRLAHGIVGDPHRADDLVQGALERVYVHWRRIQRADDPAAYTRTILVRLSVSESRRTWRRRERLSELVPETASPDHVRGTGERLDVARALSALTAKQRAVVVLATSKTARSRRWRTCSGCPTARSSGRHQMPCASRVHC